MTYHEQKDFAKWYRFGQVDALDVMDVWVYVWWHSATTLKYIYPISILLVAIPRYCVTIFISTSFTILSLKIWFQVLILKNYLNHQITILYSWVYYYNSFDCVCVNGCRVHRCLHHRHQTHLQSKLNVSMTICFVTNAYVQRYQTIRFAILSVVTRELDRTGKKNGNSFVLQFLRIIFRFFFATTIKYNERKLFGNGEMKNVS